MLLLCKANVTLYYLTILQPSLSAREHRKLQSAIKARRTQNEVLTKHIRSPGCLQHLAKVVKGEEVSTLHTQYWHDDTREAMKTSLKLGPFHMDEHRRTVRNALGVSFFY